MDSFAHNVNLSLEAEIVGHYTSALQIICNYVAELEDGQISESEFVELVKIQKRDHCKQEERFLQKYKFVNTNYEVGGILRGWYRIVAG